MCDYRVRMFYQRDVLRGKDDYTLPSNTSQEEAIQFALIHKCAVVRKAGKNAMWYIKGKDASPDLLEAQLEQSEPNKREGSYCLVVRHA